MAETTSTDSYQKAMGELDKGKSIDLYLYSDFLRDQPEKFKEVVQKALTVDAGKTLEFPGAFADKPWAEEVLRSGLNTPESSEKWVQMVAAGYSGFSRQPYASQLMADLAKANPTSFLRGIPAEYSKDPAHAAVIDQAVATLRSEPRPNALIDSVGRYADRPYASEVATETMNKLHSGWETLDEVRDVLPVIHQRWLESAIADAGNVVDRASRYDTFIPDKNEQEILEAAVTKNPRASLKYLGLEYDSHSTIPRPWVVNAYEKALQNADPGTVLEHNYEFASKPFAAEVLTAAAAKDPDTALRVGWGKGSFAEQPYGTAIIDHAVEALKDKPDRLLVLSKSFANRPYAEQVLSDAVKYMYPRDVIEWGRHNFLNQPYAENVYRAAAAARPADMIKALEDTSPSVRNEMPFYSSLLEYAHTLQNNQQTSQKAPEALSNLHPGAHAEVKKIAASLAPSLGGTLTDTPITQSASLSQVNAAQPAQSSGRAGIT